jgi:hypothetical protein
MNYIGIVIAVIGSIILIADRINSKRLSKKDIMIIALVILSLAFSVWDLQQQANEKSASSTSGMISSDSNSIIYPCIHLGNSTFVGGPQGTIPVQINNDPIQIRIENGQLIVSAIVRDESGKVVAEIVNNTWQFFTPQALESNHDDNGVEVIDQYHRVALQIDMIGSCARIAGIFYADNGMVACVSSTNGSLGFIFGNNSQIRQTIAEVWERNPNIITPIFVYPSNLNPGKRVHPIVPITPAQKIRAFGKQFGL